MQIFARISLIAVSGLFIFGDGTLRAGVPLEQKGCEALAFGIEAGQLVSLAALSEQVDNLKGYLERLQRARPGAVALATPEVAEQLQGTFGPIITFASYSRELDPLLHYAISAHVQGLLSAIPQQAAIIASGGTMGSLATPGHLGGGVGIVHHSSTSMGFKTMSITSASGFKYDAAPSDFLLFSLGSWGSESRLMLELSKALVLVGGGEQSYREATEYLQYNPKGILVLIDDEDVGGSGQELLRDPRFRKLAGQHPNIIIAKSGTDAGMRLTEKLGLRIPDFLGPVQLDKLAPKLNFLSPEADFHLLVPNSRIVGFSGWSDFRKAGVDLVKQGKMISQSMEQALQYLHQLFVAQPNEILYATAGNDPQLGNYKVPAFESLVHALPQAANVRYVALTSTRLKLAELNPRVNVVSYVAPDWRTRLHQFVSRLDILVTAGGNDAIIDQAIHADLLKKPHIHISGANTLTDLRISRLKNPNLRIVTPEEALKITGETIEVWLKPSPAVLNK